MNRREFGREITNAAGEAKRKEKKIIPMSKVLLDELRQKKTCDRSVLQNSDGSFVLKMHQENKEPTEKMIGETSAHELVNNEIIAINKVPIPSQISILSN
jgi:hypothetical protein